jgi:pilus assembly protein CpaE
MGATEFLIRPLSGEQFSPVLARLSQVSNNAPIGGARIISVLPVKGACGASTIALNLAFQWRRMGTRRILLADMDPATGIASFQLKIKSSYSFMDAISRAGTLDADLWKGLVTSVQGMDILLSPENAIDVNAELPDPTSVLDFCRQAYDIVVMDLGSAFSQWSTMVADGSDDLLLVSTNELPALRATQKVLQNLEKNKIDRSRIKLVINRYSPDVGLNQDTIQTALHTEVFHTIPSDYESVQAALVEGKAVPPSSTFGKSLAALAKQLGGQVVKAKPPAKKNSGIGGFFSSLVSKVSG